MRCPFCGSTDVYDVSMPKYDYSVSRFKTDKRLKDTGCLDCEKTWKRKNG